MTRSLRDVFVVGDIGSTFTKLAVISRSGELIARHAVLTDQSNLATGVEAAADEITRTGAHVEELLLCSSAAGGLRVGVVGNEPLLTVEAGRRAAATAGARIVASLAGALNGRAATVLFEARPDVILLTGGTNGGDRSALIENGRLLSELLDETVSFVVAGNEEAYGELDRVLRGRRIVRFAPNVLPQIGQLEVEGAQHEIRELFIHQVMGHGRFATSSAVANAIQMPTPAAVLAGIRLLARLGRWQPALARPVLIDVGGATTDVHSVLPVDPHARAYGDAAVPRQEATRTVEGDLGVRENAAPLVEEGCRAGYIGADEAEALRPSALRRSADRAFLPRDAAEVATDRRLATVAAAVALSRHAGDLRVLLSDEGATIRKSGRDLRAASCIVASGGILESGDGVGIAQDAVKLARAQQALVPARPAVLVDSNHMVGLAGLLATKAPAVARKLLLCQFATPGAMNVA